MARMFLSRLAPGERSWFRSFKATPIHWDRRQEPFPVQNSGGSALSVAVDPTTRFFYIGETLANSSANRGRPARLQLQLFELIIGHTHTDFRLSDRQRRPFAECHLAAGSGEYVYVANGQGNTAAGNIAWLPLTASGTTYTIAAGKTIWLPEFSRWAWRKTTRISFVLAVSDGGSTTSGNPDLDAYTISSGALTAAMTSVTGTDPWERWRLRRCRSSSGQWSVIMVGVVPCHRTLITRAIA